ncbi:diphosphomevalonate decarboxylase [bacterium]|nr:diphosphomevalonate decarboxylase [bacterium]
MWEASAPSNIALIKYMGKRPGGNIASNASLSWTLDHLRSFVQLEQAEQDSWQPHPAWPSIEMSEVGREKYLAHLLLVKNYFSAENYFFQIRSGNNFPADCGIASSASSFAALTLAAAQALSSLTKKAMPTKETLADWSRQGSGSSCRSFFPGFVGWTERGVEPVESGLKNIYHQTVIVSGAKKSVSSSQAHQRVQSSLLMDGREERAQKRFDHLKTELQKVNPDWKTLFEITWADFWDMHALFETSVPSFGYMQSGSLEVLQQARGLWLEQNDGPLITMDAGPNVHLLWRGEQKEMARVFSKKHSRWQWIESEHE